jgi:hypothetical protein
MLYIGQELCLPRAADGDVISAAVLSQYIRMLWEQHVYWTRLFIISTVFNLPDKSVVTERLLRNPKDFAAILRPFYGDAGASRFEELLTAHLSIAGQLVTAALTNDTAAAAQYEKQWYENADSIAAFLSRINPNWSYERWRMLLFDHLAMTKKEAVAYITHNFGDSITVFDQIEKQALQMADYMTSGIVAQFPDSFTL